MLAAFLKKMKSTKQSMNYEGFSKGTNYLKSSHWRVITIILLAVAIFVLVTILYKSRTTSAVSTFRITLPSMQLDGVTSGDDIWSNIKLKSGVSTGNWSKSKEGVLFRCFKSRKCFSERQYCRTNDTLIPLTFSTPGGSVTAYVYDKNDTVTFETTVKPSLTPMLILMAENPSVTFIDVGADVGIASLAVASIGNPVLAFEPYHENTARFCHGVTDSRLEGRCYISTNVLMDDNKIVRIIPGEMKKDYVINYRRSSEGYHSNTLLFYQLLREFPMGKAAIRFGSHYNATKVLLGSEKFFLLVKVKFVFVSWINVQAQQTNEFVLDFLTTKRFTPYAYKDRFVRLELMSSETWPDNVIFISEEGSDSVYPSTPANGDDSVLELSATRPGTQKIPSSGLEVERNENFIEDALDKSDSTGDLEKSRRMPDRMISRMRYANPNVEEDMLIHPSRTHEDKRKNRRQKINDKPRNDKTANRDGMGGNTRKGNMQSQHNREKDGGRRHGGQEKITENM